MSRQFIALANVLDSIGGSLLNISDLEIQFPDFGEGPLIAAIGQLAYQISNTYTNQILLQMHKVIGCSNLLGNPVNLLNNYRQSLQDVFVRPVLQLGNEPQ
mmetsp:Transcript_7184/g.915  ORF Transcript_7184/g.915 Transcript_7184/m.915 type:complete len:101 (+) Transcript_7184:3425-3727(+)